MLERLATDLHEFDFFQALRLLQAASLEKPRIGESVSISQDIVMLAQEPHMQFAPSAIESFSHGGAEARSRMVVNCFGLLGPDGPMPLHITELVLARIRDGDHVLEQFLNVLQHRVMGLFFRAWALNQKTVDLDRRDGRNMARYVASIAGIGMEALQNRDEVPDLAKLYYAGRLACVAKNVDGLEAIVSGFFCVPCEVQEFCGHWITIPPEGACKLGKSPATGCIGMSLIVGSKVWQAQTKFRLRIGPLTREQLHRFLPTDGSGAWRRLKAWVRNYVGLELNWDVQFVLRADQVTAAQLGGGMLGWTTWTNTGAPERDADDVIIDADLN